MDHVAYFTTLAHYNAWATQRLLDAVAVLPEDDYRRAVGLFFKSIHGTLNHLLVGEHHIWYVRYAEGKSPQLDLGQELEPDRVRLAQRMVDGAARWAPLIAGFSPKQWTGQLDYVTTKGAPTSLPFVPTLAHVFNHGTHHRGQITAALTALNQDCPVLDLAYMLLQEQKPI